jgi:hypothetical protein
MTDEIDIPTVDLWMLLEHFPFLRIETGDPEPGSEDLLEAHAAVRTWLVEKETDIPTLDLWLLLKRYPLPRTESGEPAPGSEDLHGAHAAVRAWLANKELDLGLPSFEDTGYWAEFDYRRSLYGLCPKCRRNDDYLMVRGEYWSMCHRHRLRWEVSPDVINDMFVPEALDVWEDRFRPVGKYKVVKPLVVAEPEVDDNPIKFEDLHRESDGKPEPHLRLVPKPEHPESPKPVPDPWSPGRATAWDHAVRLVMMIFVLYIAAPWERVCESVEDLCEWFERDEDEDDWVQNGCRVGPPDPPSIQ